MNGRPQLSRQPLHRRVLGAAAAVAATVLLLLGLAHSPLAPLPVPRALPAAITVFLPLPRRDESPRVRPPPPELPSAERPRRTERAMPRADRTPRTVAEPMPPVALPRPPAAAPRPSPAPLQIVTVPTPVVPGEAVASAPTADAARAPLRLDAEVVRSAASNSRGRVMSMADAAGRGTEDQRNPQATWGSAVRAAGRADCLKADEHASLLSAFSIAARAVTGRCP